MAILVLNPGSTTLKASLIHDDGTVSSYPTIETWDLGAAARGLLAELDPSVTAIGCRVVHGGRNFTEPTLVTPDVICTIEALGELAPLHNYGAAAVLKACLELAPNLPTVAVFDTAFHAHLPAVAHTYALPYELTEREGIVRYGFHGVAHESTSKTLAKLLLEEGKSEKRIITCHLGGGDSLCAILDGKSVDTTMGFTPLEGVMMATRSGDIDPDILFFLTNKGWDTQHLQHMLNSESGLLGVSGLSVDPRVLIEASSQGNERATLAIDLFTYRISKSIAALSVPLSGIDGISFSGGIGQHSAYIREKICQPLSYLGIILDQTANYSGEFDHPVKLNSEQSSVSIWSVPSNEEQSIAQTVTQLLAPETH